MKSLRLFLILWYAALSLVMIGAATDVIPHSTFSLSDRIFTIVMAVIWAGAAILHICKSNPDGSPIV